MLHFIKANFMGDDWRTHKHIAYSSVTESRRRKVYKSVCAWKDVDLQLLVQLFWMQVPHSWHQSLHGCYLFF